MILRSKEFVMLKSIGMSKKGIQQNDKTGKYNVRSKITTNRHTTRNTRFLWSI